MNKLNALKKHLRQGQVYRRADLLLWSNAIDRHLGQLVKEGLLTKLSGSARSLPVRPDALDLLASMVHSCERSFGPSCGL